MIIQSLTAPSALVITQSIPNGIYLEAEAGEDVILSCQVNEAFPPAADVLWIDQRVGKLSAYLIIIF